MGLFAKFDMDALNKNRKANYAAVIVAALVTAVLGVFAVDYWLASGPKMSLEAMVPGMAGRPDKAASGPLVKDLAGTFQSFEGVAGDLPGAWASFRGPNFDNVVQAGTPLANEWPTEGPEVLWSVEIGEGYASPVILNGRVYLLDYDQEEKADAIRCFSLDDGREIWRRSYKLKIKRNHGMSRTVPAITEKYLVTVGPKCHVVCLDAATGDYRWGIDLQTDYGTTEPLWYTGQCPLIEDGNAIIAPSGTDTLMMAVRCETGEVVWKTPNARGWEMSHSSIIPMTILGKKMYVYAALGGLSGVSAEGDDIGELLWDQTWGATVVAPSPVQVEDDRIFMTAGYGSGSMMLQFSQVDGAYAIDILYATEPDEGLACEQQTPIYHDGLLYGIMPKDGGGLKNQFVCYRPDGTMAWSSGQDNRYGLGPFLVADNKFYLLSDDGVLTMADAQKDTFVKLGQTKIALLEGHDAWGPLALAGDRLFLRNSAHMVCLNVGTSPAATSGS